MFAESLTILFLTAPNSDQAKLYGLALLLFYDRKLLSKVPDII
jgi:hypothetical protein